MLQQIRDKITGWIAGVIIALIAVTFIFWGVGDFGASGRDAVAVVDGDEIPRREFEQVYQRQLFQYNEMYDGNVPDEVRRELRQRVVDGLVQERLLLQRAESRGYRIGDDDLARAIESIEAFQVGGRFSIDAYRARLSAQGMSPSQFEERQRQSMAVDLLQDAIADTNFYTPSEFRRYIELAQQRREVRWVRIGVDRYLDEIEAPSDDAVADYYEVNRDRFLRPESVDLEYVQIRLADVARDIPVDDAALRDYYERSIADAAGPEERRASHILISADDRGDAEARALAESLLARIRDGEDFAELAREYSDDTGSGADGGDLGWAEPGFFVEEFEDALWDLSEAGELAGPVETIFGWHVIRLDEIRESDVAPFEEMRDTLAEDFARDRAEAQFIDRANALADAAFEFPDDLASIAEAESLELRRVDEFTREGADVFDDSQPVVAAAFSPEVLLEGQVSPLVEIGDDTVVMVRVIEHREAEPRPLDEVRDEIVEQLRVERASALATETASRMLERLREGADGEAVEEEFGLALGDARFVTRQQFNAVPADLLFNVFEQPRPAEGQSRFGRIELDSGDIAVYELLAVEPGDPQQIEAMMRDIEKDRLAREAGFQDFALYISALEQAARVRRQREAVEEEVF